MLSISDILKKHSTELDHLDLELIIAHSLKKTREFVLTHPEFLANSKQQSAISKNIRRRILSEPIAYILGHKEFYGLDFIVNKDTLVPRPETELLVDEILKFMQTANCELKTANFFDIGTGSGNIIIAIAHELVKNTKYKIQDTRYYAIDISRKALAVAQKNAKKHNVDKKIKFIHGSLFEPFIKNSKIIDPKSKIIIIANLPYLSKDIYKSTPKDVKKYEPKSALYSPQDGLQHYKKLLNQIKKLLVTSYELQVTAFFEISPEQKQSITKIIKNIFPSAKIEFKKDLTGRWRICKITI